MLTRLARIHDEGGYALILLSVAMVGLTAVAALGIDVGSWYLRSSQIQRAADAASLAGAGKMPDHEAALAAAQAVAAKNGFVDGRRSISVTFTPRGSHQFFTEIHDDDVPVYFAKMFLDTMHIKRSATAEFIDTVPLGSPFNVLGTGDLTTGSTVAEQNYWLAINGSCTPKEDGDLFASKYDASKTSTGVLCPGGEENADYKPTGYDYVVDVPSGTGSVNIKVYDGAFGPGRSGSVGMSPDATGGDPGSTNITTTFKVWDEQGSVADDDDTLVASETFSTDDPRVNANGGWWTLATVTNTYSTRHRWRVSVSTADEPDSFGVNAFGLMADRTSVVGSACDSRTLSTCPQVYGRTALSVFANLNPSGSAGAHVVDFYLADVSANYAGKPFHVALWDPGEGGKSIQLLAPNGTAMPFTYDVSPAIDGESGSTDELDVSGTGEQPGPNRGSEYRFNDRLVQMTVTLPTDYSSYQAADGSYWWRIRYTIPPNGLPRDRATWSAVVGGGDPVHLIRG